MKHLIFIFSCFFLFPINILAQYQTFSLSEVDKAPLISNCTDSINSADCFIEKLNQYIERNIDIMKLVKKRNVPGKAYVQFVIKETGEVKEVKVRTRNKYLEKEAIRLFSDLKIKQSATINSEKVSLKHTIPITFNLSEFDSYEEFGRKFKNKN